MTCRTETFPRADDRPSLHTVWLADRPDAAEIVAGWTYEAWGRAAGRSFDDEVALTRGFAGKEPPMMLLALCAGKVVGSAALQLREMAEYPDYEHWLSAVFVAPEARGRRIASSLVDAILEQAARLGIEHIYLRTEDLTGGLYRRHGFEPLTTIEDEGHRALLMSRPIGA